ncbi:GNAT family N-acetyltransferase [Longitalea luteola]|uniref:GNAT family N-acetyltransferase n=1 Tax=Longitalea luteola TaxID=2812563 RepID=UPI001A96F973|nr:GNAT family N-acetyltransferase [Longitalea luteola]
MKLVITRYSDEHAPAWNELVENSINGTFLHSRQFFDHNPLNKQDDCSFLFFKKNKVAAVIPCSLYEREGKRILHSHMRSTYGGFVINEEIGMEEAVEMVDKLVTEARAQGVQEIIIRNPFRIFHRKLCDEIDYALWYHGFTIKSRELETAVRLGGYEQVQSLYDDSTKRSVKKSRQNVSVQLSEDFKSYWTVLEQNLLKKHNTKPTHSYNDFVVLLNKVGHDKIKLFAAFKDSNLIAGIIVFVTNNMVLHAQYIASDELYQEFRPLNAVIDEIIQWGCNHGYTFLNLGTSNTDGGRTINGGLFRFKEGFGGRNTLRETMHLILK